MLLSHQIKNFHFSFFQFHIFFQGTPADDDPGDLHAPDSGPPALVEPKPELPKDNDDQDVALKGHMYILEDNSLASQDITQRATQAASIPESLLPFQIIIQQMYENKRKSLETCEQFDAAVEILRFL